jgi:hypothetical protein
MIKFLHKRQIDCPSEVNLIVPFEQIPTSPRRGRKGRINQLYYLVDEILAVGGAAAIDAGDLRVSDRDDVSG